MNYKNSKSSDPHILLLNLSKKIKRSNKDGALSNISIYYTWKNRKTSFKNNKIKISVPTWNEKFDVPDGSHSVSNIQNYFEHIFKKI